MRKSAWRTWAGLAAVLAAEAWGAWLRLKDPLANPVVAAEDPFTHMALVREHLADGRLDPMSPGSGMYPPGMHSIVAAWWVNAGGSLIDLARFAPVVWGLFGIAGIALLLWRFEGPLAASAGALLVATLPEAVFRSGLFAPTALDLALLPFLLWALLETLQGRTWYALAAGPIALLLLLAHPWLFAVVAPALALLVILAFLLAWRAPLSPRGVGLALATVGIPAAASLAGCWGACGPGFSYVATGGGGLARWAAPGVMLVTFGALVAWRWPKDFRLGRTGGDSPRSLAVRRTALASVLLLAVAALGIQSYANGLPEHVDLARMFGYGVLALAGAGLAALPWSRRPVGVLGAAWTLWTLPFVLTNPLHSPYWPHRTAVYLGLGACMLAASLVGWAGHEAAKRVARRAQAQRRFGRARRLALGTAALMLAASAAAAAAAPPPYEGGWYRLFDGCGNETLQQLAARLDEEPNSLVLTGDWQSKLVIAASVQDAQRIWYKPEVFLSPSTRATDLADAAAHHRSVYLVFDGHARRAGLEAPFASLPPWERVGPPAGCAAGTEPDVTLYVLHGGL